MYDQGVYYEKKIHFFKREELLWVYGVEDQTWTKQEVTGEGPECGGFYTATLINGD